MPTVLGGVRCVRNETLNGKKPIFSFGSSVACDLFAVHGRYGCPLQPPPPPAALSENLPPGLEVELRKGLSRTRRLCFLPPDLECSP